MFPEYICNLLATVRYPPWTKELNWGLHMTMYGEERIPFHSYVQPGTTSPCFPGYISSMPQFSTLPVELQLRILSFCSACTLFQVMHVSSTLRIEASKLFWANPDAYFQVEAQWLLDGGHPGGIGCDLPFLLHVQNVEIEYHRGQDSQICPRPDEVMEVRQELITTLWRSFKKRFPNVKRVVVNKNWPTRPWRNEIESVSQELQILFQYCPLAVEAFAFILEEENPTMGTRNSDPSIKKWQRSLYRRSAGDVWTRVATGRRHKTILMPMKHFHGPVGGFERLKYKGERLLLQKYGLWPLSLEALDRHYFNNEKHKSFSCPYSDCGGYFEKAGEWTVHATKSHAMDWRMGGRFCILPDELRVVFEERERVLEGHEKEVGTQLRKRINEWNEEGVEKQRQIEREWMEQLENDEAWNMGKTARESRLWREFVEQMEFTRHG
ncbi:hypothetical protein P154DRAFT_118594 [Amniculicola lignicola CBS 123094]|uniref:C2H2-type domain-containing protein n=1 Tax=Amniculicola lignicola CBS 123094 TaxID=1392246 RepID=A0A6A5X392_9PLEO|nr:hypothetical protein P154DRAFT_118594 [Amniculicola lignicola CBS 123094]